jgi:DNA-binding MarR family transcriptional regulator
MASELLGSQLYLNVDTAFRAIDQIYKIAFENLELLVVEAYILCALYEEDGQRANSLARAVGRAPTSFTPILDKIAAKGLVERRPEPSDRRAINIYLTEKGNRLRKPVQAAFEQADKQVNQHIPADLMPAFQNMLLLFHNLPIRPNQKLSG